MEDILLDAESRDLGEFFRQVVMESADAVVAVNRDHKLVLFSPAAERLFGYSSDEILGKSLNTLLPHRYRSGHSAKVKEFQAGQSPARYMGDRKSHLLGLHADGSEVMLGATILTVTTDDGPIMVAMLRDIGERIRLQQELAHMASADPLTGQLNRRAFLESLEREWHRACRYKTELSLLMFDLDNFKSINDRFGHDLGDQVIQRFSGLVRSSLRDIDIFGRWGGEEFIAALPHTNLRSARSIAERIRESFASEKFEAAGRQTPFSVTVSIGVAGFCDGDTSHSEMIKGADDALYAAKNAGRNRVLTWSAPGNIRALASGTDG